MTITTIIRFLFGGRRAIFEVATTRSAVWLGLLFVFSAGFAREYDGEDLLHEPWHLLLPLVASLVTSFILFAAFWDNLGRRTAKADPNRSFLASYRSFLGMYWMTAPLAWLYAIPFEQFLSASGATRANLFLLGVVAIWRVLLMIRICSVMFGARVSQATPLVMLFSVTVVLVLLGLTPLPVVSVMGGIRLTDSERLIRVTTFNILAFCILSFPIWLIWAITLLVRERAQWNLAPSVESQRIVSKLTWVLGVLSITAWAVVLPYTQPSQQLRRQVERELTGGQIDSALVTMSNHQRDNFPAHWEPPPRVGYGEERPDVLDVLGRVIETEPSPWIARLYVEKLSAGGYLVPWRRRLDSQQFDQLLNVLERLPQSRDFVERNRRNLERQIGEDSERTPEQQRRLRLVLGVDETNKPSP
jgi:hypothetical protein